MKRAGLPLAHLGHSRMTPFGTQAVQLAAAILLLSACSSNPPIISGDTSCERFRHISATDAQIEVFKKDWGFWESYADQIVQHNVEYDGHCLKVTP